MTREEIIIQKISNGMVKKKLAYSIATFILDETTEGEQRTAVEMYSFICQRNESKGH